MGRIFCCRHLNPRQAPHGSQLWSRARLRISLTLLLLAATSVPPLMAQSWYDSAWTSRQQITINSNAGAYGLSASLTKFPFLVKITDSANDLFTRAQASGNDILFTAEDGITKIPHEIENYSNGGSKDLTAWVQLPIFRYNADNGDLHVLRKPERGEPAAETGGLGRNVWICLSPEGNRDRRQRMKTARATRTQGWEGRSPPTRRRQGARTALPHTARTSMERTTTSRCPDIWGSRERDLQRVGEPRRGGYLRIRGFFDW